MSEHPPASPPPAPAVRTKTRTTQRVQNKPKHLPPYHVILLNDDDHTFDYVIEMLGVLFAHPAQDGSRMAKEVDTEGRVIVLTCHKEKAELKQEQIHAYGSDTRVATCEGSMSAVIEPAED